MYSAVYVAFTAVGSNSAVTVFTGLIDRRSLLPRYTVYGVRSRTRVGVRNQSEKFVNPYRTAGKMGDYEYTSVYIVAYVKV